MIRIVQSICLMLLMLGASACGSVEEGGPLVINEVSAYNDQKDWFELYNPSGQDIDLSDWQFTDNIESQKNKVAFPSGTVLKAGGYVVIELSDDWPGFKLGRGEQLGVIDPSGALIASLNWSSEHSVKDMSYGRSPNGTGAFAVLRTPTPGQANAE